MSQDYIRNNNNTNTINDTGYDFTITIYGSLSFDLYFPCLRINYTAGYLIVLALERTERVRGLEGTETCTTMSYVSHNPCKSPYRFFYQTND